MRNSTLSSLGRPLDHWSCSLSEIIDPIRYKDPQWERLHRDLESYSVDKHVFRHLSGEIVRKGYEWTQCIFGLEALGMLKPEAKALGVGAGHEPVIFWLADRVAHVVATDLYGNETWTSAGGVEAAADVLDRPERYCPRPISKDKITFQSADGTNLPFADESFDFCWSLSSIEHFGGHNAAAMAMREMARVTKPGGIVCVATEVLLRDDQTHPECFTRHEFDRFILKASPVLVLVGQMRWNVDLDEYIRDPIILPQDVARLRRHVVLQAGEVQWTSAIAFLRKGGRKWYDVLQWLSLRKPHKPGATSQAAVEMPPYSINHHLIHNSARCEAFGGKFLHVTTPSQPWSYAVELPLQCRPQGRGLKVEISANVRNNPVRFGILKSDGTEFIQEVEIGENANCESVELVVPADSPIGSLIVRTATAGSGVAEFEITACELFVPPPG